MALTGMAIFNICRRPTAAVRAPTCLAFAMKLAAGGASLDQCPFVSDEAKAVLAEASAPPIRGVTIGEGEFALKVGEELVMHRHEKTFFNPCGYALLIEDTEAPAAVAAKVAALKAATYERVAQTLRSNLVAVKNASGDAASSRCAWRRLPGRSSTARADGRAGGDRGAGPPR
jgi:acetyl-CoA decarbonylase/synthase complex subunit gamma